MYCCVNKVEKKMVVEIKQPKINKYKATYPHYKRFPKCPVGWTIRSRMRDSFVHYIKSSVSERVVKMAAVNAWLRDQLEDPTVKEVKESDYYNCITLYKMVEICLKELIAKQILYVFPSILNNADHDVFLSKSDLYTAMKYDMHKIMQIILEDKNKIENI